MTPCIRTAAASVFTATRSYFRGAEAVLVALDARPGKEVWTTTVDDYKNGY